MTSKLKRTAISLDKKYAALMSLISKEKTPAQIILELHVKHSTVSGWILSFIINKLLINEQNKFRFLNFLFFNLYGYNDIHL